MSNWELCRIGKEYAFEAAHWLPMVHEHHKCRRMHGHSYRVEVEVRGEIAPKDGFCNNLDFSEVDGLIKPIIESMDHRVLNELPGLDNPTAENIAAYILRCANEQRAIIFSVKVWETPKCWAMVVSRNGIFKREHRE